MSCIGTRALGGGRSRYGARSRRDSNEPLRVWRNAGQAARLSRVAEKPATNNTLKSIYAIKKS